MTATIHYLPKKHQDRRFAAVETEPCQVAAVANLVVNIRERFWYKLNNNQKHIVMAAEQLSMRGHYASAQHRMLKDLYAKLKKDSFTSWWCKWFGRNLRKAN